MTTLKKIAPFIVILFGFAVRMYAMDTTWIDGDRANPHGIGIGILDALSRGAFNELPLFSDGASVGLPNPPFISYLFAVIAIADRSLLFATAFGLMLNTLAIACAFVIGNRVLNWEAGLLSATLLAASTWGVYLARGAWHPGELEIGVVLTAWLLMLGVTDHNGKRLFAGFVAAAITAGTYLVGFAVLVQAMVATLVAMLPASEWRPAVRRAWLASVGVCAAAVMLYTLALAHDGLLGSVAGLGILRSGASVPGDAAPLARDLDLTSMNRNAMGHFARLASGADYALIWTDPQYGQYDIRQPLTQAQAIAITLSMVIGLGWMLINIRRQANRFLMTWAAVPVVALIAIAFFKRDFEVAPYYLLLTAPVPYVAGGVGLAVVARAMRFRIPTILALCAALAIVPAWNFVAAAQSVYKQPFTGHVDFMPLRWSLKLGDLWRTHCQQVNGTNHWWEISLAGSSNLVRRGGVRYNDFSSMWSVLPDGGTCALKQMGAPLPNAEMLPLPLNDGSVLRTYRSLPHEISRDVSTTVNLGWSLLDFSAPTQVAPGSKINVRHAWRVDTLPNEPHDTWYFAPFVKLIAPDGKVVMDVDGAAGLAGWEWRPHEIMLSQIELDVPDNLPPADYVLQSSLFDPNQKKNAVYFNANEPDKPVLTLERTIRIENSSVTNTLSMQRLLSRLKTIPDLSQDQRNMSERQLRLDLS